MVRAMNIRQEDIDYCASEVREHDLERYYVSLFMPANTRPGIWAVLAFNQEVAKTHSVVSEPMLGEIRLQWWREALDSIEAGAPREHPVVQALASIEQFGAIRPMLERVIDGWAKVLEADQTDLSDLVNHAEETGGVLVQALTLILDPAASKDTLEASLIIGKIWTLTSGLKALPLELGRIQGEQSDAADAASNSATDLQQTLKRLVGAIEQDVERVEVAGHEAGRHIYSMTAISRLHVKALKAAGFDLERYFSNQPSDLRKLIALSWHHLTRR